ncbi:alkaline phosphatase family protein [bacterium]|nr:alkaline phosphatase family protein [bacterium]
MVISKNRVIIIGLDGATFDFLDPLIESGVLPRLAKFRNQSAHGTLWSTNPPTTPPAWTTCTTGLNPGRHGIYDFTTSPLANPARPLVTARSARGLRLWHILDQNNLRSVFVNVPITYPPEQINGCMISGMMTPGFNSPFTHPANLRDRLKAVCGNYIPNIDIPKYDTASEKDALVFLEDVRETLDRRREAIRHLMDTEKWDVFMVVFIGIDRILHLFAKYLFPGNSLYNSPTGKRLRPLIIQEIIKLDDVVGEMIDRTQPNDTVFILSDHGFGVTDGFFNANTWLLNKNLLTVKSLPYAKTKTFHTLQKIGENPFVQKIIPAGIQSTIRRKIRKTRSTMHSARTDLDSVVDWSKTRAFFGSIPAQGIFINEKTPENYRGIVEPDELDALKTEIKSALLELKHPETGENLTDKVWFREEIFHGDQTRFAPHILFRMKNYSVLGRQHLGTSGYYTSASHQPIGFHRSNGMVMIRNKAIQAGTLEADMTDIMPTVLFSAGLAVPEGLDGKVLTEIFSSEFMAENPVEYADISGCSDSSKEPSGESDYSDTDRDEVEERLRNLGYLE